MKICKSITRLGVALIMTFTSGCLTLSADENWEWNEVNINGMGWVTGVAISRAAPYQMYAKTDVGGAYRYNRETEKWEQMMDSFGYDERGSFSVESIATDPNDGRMVYVAANQTSKEVGSEIWKSKDSGHTWTATGLRDAKPIYMGGNDEGRSEMGERLAIDPNNGDVLYFGSRRDGLWRKLGNNGWERVGGLPGDDFAFVVFDKNGGTTEHGGVKMSAIFYVGAEQGIYKTTDGGLTFNKMASGRTAVQSYRGAVNDDGVFAATCGNGHILRGTRESDTLTVAVDTKDVSVSGLAVQTDGKSFVVLATEVSKPDGVFISNADATGWKRKNQVNRERIPYQNTDWCHPERGGFVIDFADASGNTAFAGTGFGVVKTTDLLTGEKTVHWDDHTSGISELVMAIVKTPPIKDGPDLIIACSDMGGFVVQNRDEIPQSRLAQKNIVARNPEWNIPLTGINGMDFSYNHPENMAYTGWHQFGWYTDYALKFGTSTDGGQTWDEITVPKDEKAKLGLGEYDAAGALAMSSSNPKNLVWSPDNGTLKYSTDMGKSWREANIPSHVYSNKGITGTMTMYERAMPFWSATQNLQADKINGNVFYLLTTVNSTRPEFYRSEDGGKNWKLTYTGADNATDFLKINAYLLPSVNIRVNPMKEGDVFVVTPTWFDDNKSFIHRPMWRSTDKTCKDFAVVPNVQSAMAVGFGAGDKPDTPYIYLYGQANGDKDFGVYVSRDDAKTWTRITAAEKQFGNVCGIEGDMRYKDLVYVYFGGRGVVYGIIP
jgi:hypothetical protein